MQESTTRATISEKVGITEQRLRDSAPGKFRAMDDWGVDGAIFTGDIGDLRIEKEDAEEFERLLAEMCDDLDLDIQYLGDGAFLWRS